MTGCTPSAPKRADARRNRERLLAAARQVFLEQGTDASLRDVARHAHVGIATRPPGMRLAGGPTPGRLVAAGQ